MNSSLQQSLYFLTGSDTLDSASAEKLDKISEEHPYFLPPLLLAGKYRKDQAQHAPNMHRIGLFFSNPMILHYHWKIGEVGNIDELPQIKKSYEKIENENTATVDEQLESVITTSFSAAELEEASELAHNLLHEDEHPLITKVFSTNELERASDLAHKTLGTDFEFNNEQNDAESHITDTINPKENIAAILEMGFTKKDSLVIPNEEISSDLKINQKEEFADKENEDVRLENSQILLPGEFDEEVNNTDATDKIDATENDYAPDEHELMFENIKRMLDNNDGATADENLQIPIDPYHTIDYFASQGIKVDLEKNPEDQLGKHLRSFTQWLRHMKKLGPEDALETISDKQAEVEAQRFADRSNIAKEVVTEAMAQVLERQGKKDKAVQLYDKLSFLYPHKSAYFADKIKNLKGS